MTTPSASSHPADTLPTPLNSTAITSNNGVVTCMHLTKNHIILGLDNGTLSTLDKEGKNERTVKASEAAIWALCSWDEEWIVCGGVDGMLFVLDLRTLEEKQKLSGHTSTVRWVKALSSSTVVSASRDTTIRVWDIEIGECTAVLEGHTATIRALAAHGDTLVSASYDGDARVWSLEKKECIHVLKGHDKNLYTVVFDGKIIVTGSLDDTARVWDPVSGNCLAVLRGQGLMGIVQILPSIIVTANNVGKVQVWSMEDYSQILEIDAHDHAVTSMQCDGSRIITGGGDGSAKLWNLKSGKLLKELVRSDAVWKVGFLNERAVAAFSRGQEVVLGIWDSSVFIEVENPLLH